MPRVQPLSSLVAVLAVLLTAGCGTTQIVANDPQARIWVDGEFVGRGHGEVRKVGFPGSAHVLAKTDDGRIVNQSMKRSFGWTAGLLGFLTYGVCFIACWEYPNALYVDLPARPAMGPGFGGPEPGSAPDPWLVPAPGWRDPAPSLPAPAAAPSPPGPTTKAGRKPSRPSA